MHKSVEACEGICSTEKTNPLTYAFLTKLNIQYPASPTLLWGKVAISGNFGQVWRRSSRLTPIYGALRYCNAEFVLALVYY